MKNLSSRRYLEAGAAVISVTTALSGAAQAVENSTNLASDGDIISAVSRPPVRSARVESPLSVSGVLSYPVVNAGVDVSYHLSDRFAVGGQLTTMLIHTDLTARARLFFLARPRWGLYLGANGHLIYSPLLFSFPAVGATGELGGEIRRGSWIFGFGAGAGAVWSKTAEGAGPNEHWQPYPVLNIRIGRTYRDRN